MPMKMTDLFLNELDREGVVTRKTLERVPEGKNDWKPHEKSMPLGYLTSMVALMPSWIALVINQDELDINPPPDKRSPPKTMHTARELVAALDDSIAKAKEALRNTTDEHLLTTWRMLSSGKVVLEQPRHVMMRDGVMNHLAHHRGQLTVYLRLNERAVPSIYGPSADEPV
jgi:uncharacterized damage-inducible protein DinB